MEYWGNGIDKVGDKVGRQSEFSLTPSAVITRILELGNVQ
jgi:hypothetical protein